MASGIRSGVGSMMGEELGFRVIHSCRLVQPAACELHVAEDSYVT